MGPTAPVQVRGRWIDALRSQRLWLAIGTGVLALASFAAAVGLGRALFAAGIHREWNILFDADPLVYLKNFATGHTIADWGGRNFVHPNLTNFVHVPLRALSEVLAWLPLGLGPAVELRQQLAFLVCPVVAAVRVPVLVLLLRSLGLSAGWTLSLAALDTVSFSTRLFASIPESYMLTGTLLAAVFWLGVRTARSQSRPHVGLWLGALVLLCGTSMLTLVPGAMVFLAASWRHYPPRRRLLLTLALAGAAFSLNALAYQASRAVYPSAPPFRPHSTEHLEDSWNPGPSRVADYLLSLADAYLPPAPAVVPSFEPANRRDYVFTFETGSAGHTRIEARPLAFLALLALGIASYRWLPREGRGPHLAALSVLLFGAALHAFVGHELILYAHHWKIAVVVLIAGLFYMPRAAHVVLGWGLPLIVAATAVNNALVLSGMLATLNEF